MRLPECSTVSPGEEVVAVYVDPEDVLERPAVGDERLSHRVRCVLRSGEDELVSRLARLRVPHVLRQQRPCQLVEHEALHAVVPVEVNDDPRHRQPVAPRQAEVHTSSP